MPGKRSKPQRSADLVFVSEKLSKKWPQYRILEWLNTHREYQITRQQLNKDVKHILGQWDSQVMEFRKTTLRNDLIAFQKQEEEVWDAWEKSKQDATSSTAESNKGAIGPRRKGKGRVGIITTKHREVTEGQCGDAAFQRLILDIQGRRAKLLGIDAPERVELSGPGGAPIQTADVTKAIKIPKARLEELITELSRQSLQPNGDLQPSVPDGNGNPTDQPDGLEGAGREPDGA